jgi:hypothetical protein
MRHGQSQGPGVPNSSRNPCFETRSMFPDFQALPLMLPTSGVVAPPQVLGKIVGPPGCCAGAIFSGDNRGSAIRVMSSPCRVRRRT